MNADPFAIALDRADARPLYQQIKEALASRIESGRLPPLTRLPASRSLARQLGVNRVTVVTAYAELAAEGYIGAHVGRGSFVLDRAARVATPAPPPGWRHAGEWTAHNFNREMMRLAQRPDILSFAPGMPATDLLPADAYRLALNTVLRRDGAEVLQYGLVEGYAPLHVAIASELRGFGVQAEPRRLLITNGVEQALALVLRTAVQPSELVLVEEPTYLHVLDLLASSEVTAVPVPCDESGLRVELLPDLIARHQPRLLYLTPTYQNPTGATLTLRRRQQLVDLAAAHDLLILEDDVYRHLWLAEPPPPPLRALDPADQVIYANGYSKCLLPGARVGYLLVPERLHQDLANAHQALDVTAAELHQRALTHYLAEGEFERHLQRLRVVYGQRCQAMLEAVAAYMPAGSGWNEPGGGLFLWLNLPPDGPSATTLYVHALDLGVAFAPGHLFFLSTSSRRASHSLRLNFTLHPPDRIHDGIRRLARAWERAAGAGG